MKTKKEIEDDVRDMLLEYASDNHLWNLEVWFSGYRDYIVTDDDEFSYFEVEVFEVKA